METSRGNILKFEPKSPDPAEALRKKLSIKKTGQPAESVEPRIAMRLRDQIPALEEDIRQQRELWQAEAQIVANMWDQTMDTIARSKGAENFIDTVRDAEKVLRQMGKKVEEMEEHLAELRRRVEGIDERRSEGSEAEAGGDNAFGG